MAAIDFPSSPSNGDTHTVGGVTYTYNSAETKWKTTINSNAFLPLTGGTVSGNILMGGEIQHDGDTDTNIAFGTNEIQFDTAGSERFRVGSAGQLGIGGATYGTDGQVLTSTGATTAPAWEDLPASLSWTETTASSGSGTYLVFDSLPSDFRELLIIFNNVSPTASSEIEYQLGTSSAYATSGYAQCTLSTGSGGTSTDNTVTAHGRFSATNFAAGSSAYGYLRITNPTGNTYLCHGVAWSNDEVNIRFTNTSVALSDTMTAIRFYMDGGDFDSGNWKLLYVN